VILLLKVFGALLLAVMAGLIAVFLLESETEEPYEEMSEDWRRRQGIGRWPNS
jgi:hypothetical protein